MGNVQIGNGYGLYEGTETAVKKKFNLQHNTNEIFRRSFDGSDSSVVELTNNSILIPNHFWVTGENVTYSVKTTAGVGTTGDTIGIAATEFSGVGTDSYTNLTLPTNREV